MTTSLLMVNTLAALLVVSSVYVVLAPRLKQSAFGYAVQSLILVGVFIALALHTGSIELKAWAVSATFTKVIAAPAILLFLIKKMGPQAEASVDASKAKPKALVALLASVELALAYWLVSGVHILSAEGLTLALAVSLAHFFIGITCIVTQNNIIKQVLGFCLMENGSHLTLALLAPSAPKLVEIGIATDALFAVIIMSLLAARIWNYKRSLDAHTLMDLKG